MTAFRFKQLVAVASGVAVISAASLPAVAGGLAIREQSALFQGSSFAGSAAGGGISSSFWNSAAISEFEGTFQSESHGALILGRTTLTADPTSPTNAFGGGNEAELNDPALVAASYYAYHLSRDLTVGLAINAPFGLSNHAGPETWQGRVHHRSGNLFTMNANPMVSYQVAPGVRVGVGAQVQYAKLLFKTKASPLLTNNSVLDGDDIGFGFTAGVLLQPSKDTSIGLGFRSSVSHTLEGDAFVAAAPALGRSGFELGLDTPDMVTLSVSQKVSDRLRAMATVEWTNWSRLDVHPVVTTTGPGVGGAPPGTTIAVFDFQYDDGWFFSVGGEYDYSPHLTLRSGVAYEISPVQNASQRLLQVPDSNRIWLSVGATYQVSDKLAVDFGYSHIFFENGRINRLPATTNPLLQVPFVGEADATTDIIAASFKYKW